MFSTKLRYNLIPFYCITKLFLLSPFSINYSKTSDSPPTVSYIGSFHSIATLAIYSTFHLYASTDKMQGMYYSFVSLAIDTYNRYLGLVLICIMTISSVIKQQKVIHFIQLLEQCDKDFEEKLFVSNEDNIKWMRQTLIRILVLIGLSSYLESINCLMYIQDLVSFSNFCMLMCYVTLFINSVTEFQFTSYLNLIKNRLEKINTIIDKLKKANSLINSDTIEHFYDLFIISEFNSRNKVAGLLKYDVINKITNENEIRNQILALQTIYNNLFDASKIILDAYEIPLVFLALGHFTTLTSLLYFCASNAMRFVQDFNISGDEIWELLTSFGWIIMYTEKIYSIANICQTVKEESYKIGRYLHVIGLNLKLVENKRVVKIFSHQILHQRINFIPCGLYEIDLSFMISVVGAVTTYVAILLQFDDQTQTTQHEKTSTFMKINLTTNNHHG